MKRLFCSGRFLNSSFPLVARWLVAASGLLLLQSFALASTPELNNVTQGQFDQVIRDFSADSTFTSVSPASSLSNYFGFEVGLVGGIANTPNINSLAQSVDPTVSVPYLPNAGLLGAITVPGSVTLEALVFPSETFSGVSYSQIGGSVKWTFTDNLWILPFSMAVKGVYGLTQTSFSQTIQNSSTGNIPVTASVNISDVVSGAQLFISKDFLFFEPYLALGFLNAAGSANVTGSSTATVFAPSFTSSQSATDSTTSTELIVGGDFKLAIVRIGAEYTRLFSTDRYTAKLSLAF